MTTTNNTNNKHVPQRDVLRRFNDLSELYTYAKEAHFNHQTATHYGAPFCGGTYREALDTLASGDLSSVAAAQKIIDQMRDQLIFADQHRVVAPAIVGFAPHVPHAIIGHPKTMLNFIPSEMISSTTPINIYAMVNVSAWLSDSQVLSRGIAILSLVLALSQSRPVDLYVGSCSCALDTPTVYGSITRIDTRPLDLAHAAWMLTSTLAIRGLLLTTSRQIAGDASSRRYSVPHAYCGPTAPTYEPSLRSLIGMAPQDILIKAGSSLDKAMLDNPIKWVKDMIKAHTTLTIGA